MSNKKFIPALLCLTLITVMLSGCYKTATLLVDNSPAITTTVSFSKDLQPILTSSCAKSGCHNGSVSPDLTAANSYNSLTLGFVNTGDPSNSDVYLWLTGKKAATMPLGSSNNPSNINALVLAWINQGAKNN
jgi:hypothetical protein